MGASLLAVLMVSILLAAVARRFDVSAPLALVIAGLLASNLPGLHDVVLEPELVLYVILPPLLWSAGTESSYVALRKNLRPDQPAGGRTSAGHDVRGRVRRVQDGSRAHCRSGADSRCDRGAARRGVGDGDRQAAGPTAPHDGSARR